MKNFAEYVAMRQIEPLVEDIAKRLVELHIDADEFANICLEEYKLFLEDPSPTPAPAPTPTALPGSPGGSAVQGQGMVGRAAGWVGNVWDRIKKGWAAGTAARPDQSLKSAIGALDNLVNSMQNLQGAQFQPTRTLLTQMLHNLKDGPVLVAAHAAAAAQGTKAAYGAQGLQSVQGAQAATPPAPGLTA